MEDLSLLGIPLIILGVVCCLAGIVLFKKPVREKEEFLGDNLFSMIIYVLPWWGRKLLYIVLGASLLGVGFYLKRLKFFGP